MRQKEKRQEMIDLWKGLGFSDEEIQALLNLDYFTVRGWTPMNHGGNTKNGWQEIILMEESFKSTILDTQLSDLINSGSLTGLELRRTFYNGLCALMQGFIEGGTEDIEARIDEIKDLRMQEVWMKLFGIKMKGWESIENKRLEQILDSSSVTNEQFEDFYDSFVIETRQFLQGSTEFSKCVWELDKTKFFGFPLNKIPGCANY